MPLKKRNEVLSEKDIKLEIFYSVIKIMNFVLINQIEITFSCVYLFAISMSYRLWIMYC
jgi:hypothetical protein